MKMFDDDDPTDLEVRRSAVRATAVAVVMALAILVPLFVTHAVKL